MPIPVHKIFINAHMIMPMEIAVNTCDFFHDKFFVTSGIKFWKKKEVTMIGATTGVNIQCVCVSLMKWTFLTEIKITATKMRQSKMTSGVLYSLASFTPVAESSVRIQNKIKRTQLR